MEQALFEFMFSHPWVVVGAVAFTCVLWVWAACLCARDADEGWFGFRDEEAVHVRGPRDAA